MSAPTPEQLATFLRLYADGGVHKKAAESAGIALDVIAALLEDDDQFSLRYKQARRTRRLLIEDAVMQEALGEVRADPVSGVQRTVRNVDVLKRVAVREDIIDPDKPSTQVAVQTNVNGAASDPKLVALAKANSERLRQLLQRGASKPALPVITVDVTPVSVNEEVI